MTAPEASFAFSIGSTVVRSWLSGDAVVVLLVEGCCVSSGNCALAARKPGADPIAANREAATCMNTVAKSPMVVLLFPLPFLLFGPSCKDVICERIKQILNLTNWSHSCQDICRNRSHEKKLVSQ